MTDKAWMKQNDNNAFEIHKYKTNESKYDFYVMPFRMDQWAVKSFENGVWKETKYYKTYDSARLAISDSMSAIGAIRNWDKE